MSGNFIHIAPPEAYNQVYNYYQRVIGDGGTLIDAEAVNRIYHNLNLVNFENRNYKLYHASAGLQKTSDQIDKLYDLGKDDIDQTFSGSDRPEHVQAWSNSEGVGNWQINVEKEATNYCKESNDLGGIFGGSWTKTEGAGDSPFGDANEAVEVKMNTNSTGASNYIKLSVDTATSFSSGDYITVSFYAKKIGGSSGQPKLLIEGEDSNSNPINLIQETFSTQVGEYQFFEFTAQWSADGTLRHAGCRIQDNDTSADTVYQFWGMQVEEGQYATSRIQTDGAIGTRLRPQPSIDNSLNDTGYFAFSLQLFYNNPDQQRASEIEITAKTGSRNYFANDDFTVQISNNTDQIRFKDADLGFALGFDLGSNNIIDKSNWGDTFNVVFVATWDTQYMYLYFYINKTLIILRDTISNYSTNNIPTQLFLLQQGFSLKYEKMLFGGEEILGDKDRALEVMNSISDFTINRTFDER